MTANVNVFHSLNDFLGVILSWSCIPIIYFFKITLTLMFTRNMPMTSKSIFIVMLPYSFISYLMIFQERINTSNTSVFSVTLLGRETVAILISKRTLLCWVQHISTTFRKWENPILILFKDYQRINRVYLWKVNSSTPRIRVSCIVAENRL